MSAVELMSTSAVCSRTCLTVTLAVAEQVELAVGAVGRPAGLGQEGAQVVVRRR